MAGAKSAKRNQFTNAKLLPAKSRKRRTAPRCTKTQQQEQEEALSALDTAETVAAAPQRHHSGDDGGGSGDGGDVGEGDGDGGGSGGAGEGMYEIVLGPRVASPSETSDSAGWPPLLPTYP